MDVNLKDQVVYVAALGNNTLEVADLNSGKIIRSLTGLDEPQGVGYISQQQEIFVANGGNGDGYFYDAHRFTKTGSIHLGSDADDVRYDSVENRVYVGYGQGGMAIIDAKTHKLISNIKLPGHPESFQVDKKLNRLYVNIPDAKMVGVIDLKTASFVARWTKSNLTANFPMAVDPQLHRVFVGYRHPARLVVLDGRTGKDISTMAMAGDADDLYYNSKTSEIYASGGDGYLSVYQQQGQGTYKQVANMLTRKGARTSLFIPQQQLLVVAAPAGSSKPASLIVYKE